jgi:PAS domain S-box-containing protein
MDNDNSPAKQPGASSLYPHLIPVLLLTALIAVLHLVFRDYPIARHVFEPPLLLPILNTLFLFLVACIVSYIAMRAYLVAGSPTVLFLGCGVLTLGTGSLFAGWMMGLVGPNGTATVFNVSALVGSVFHMVAAIADLTGKIPEADPRSRQRKLIWAYLGVVVFVALLSLLTDEAIMPPFFIQETGPTGLRQVVLATAFILYVVTSLYMVSRFIQKRAMFLYWYALALALAALNLAGTYLQPTVGSAIGWAARCAVYAAGIYFLMAVISTWREARRQRVSLDESVAELFRKSEQKISSILASITDGHYELDREWRFIGINDQALAYFGRGREEFIGRSYWDVFLGGRDSIFEKQFRKTLSESVSVHFDVQSVAVPDKWVKMHAYPTEEGGISVFFRDITENKRAEEELRQSEERLRLVLQASSIGTFEVDLQTGEGRWNPLEYELLGLKPGDVPGNPESFFRYVHPEDVALLTAKWEEALQTGKLDAEFRIVRADGRERWLAAKGRFAFDSEVAGRALRFLGTNFDITDRKEAEETLRQSQEEYRHIVEGSGSVILRADRDLRITFMNRYGLEFFGYSAHEIIGRNALGTIIPEKDDGGQDIAAMARDLREHPDRYPSNVHQNRRKDGSLVWMSWANKPIYDDQGNLMELLVVGNDLSKLKQMEEELRRSRDELELRVQERTAELSAAYESLQRETEEHRQTEEKLRQAQKMEALGTLAGGIAHDFNNILASVLGFTEMAIDDVEDRPLVARNLNNVLKSAMRARELVKQILAFSRKTKYERSPQSLSPVVKETVQLLRASIPATVDMKLVLTATSDTVLASPVEIQQILMNLATNASIAMEQKGGTMEVSLADIDFEPDSPVFGPDVEPGEYIQLTVKDTGVGMEPGIMKRVFEPFFTTREVGKGSGMGLAVVYGIVRDLQGTITVESEAGKGSTFRVTLPKVKSVEKEGHLPVVRVPGGKERILFVDDEEMLVEWGQNVLQRLGYTVTGTTDSTAAFTAFSADPARFDLVITDQTMSRMAGIELARMLLAVRPDIPIILCTGHSETVSPERAKETGIREFLMKPLARQELAAAVRRVLDGKGEE